MNKYDSWRSVADQQFGETRDQFRNIKPDHKLLFLNTCTVREQHWNMCAYYEIYFDMGEKSLYGVGTVFSKSVGTAYLSSKNLISETCENNGFTTLNLTAITGAFSERKFEVKIKQKIDHANRTWELQEIATTLIKEPSLLNSEPSLIFKNLETFSSELEFNSDYESLCQNCMGEGKFVTFAVPKSAATKGLTGYALYSENTINAEHACAVCGGKGKKYKDWYLKERSDEVHNSEYYDEGSGIMTFNRMRPVQVLSIDS